VLPCPPMFGPLNTLFAVWFTLGMCATTWVTNAVDRSGALTRRFTQFWARTLCRGCGIEVAVSGGEAVRWTEPHILMANHQSYLDIPVLFAALPEPFGMLAKQELFRLPVFRSAMKGLRCIPINRGNRRESLESLRAAAERVRSGNTIVVFPEGTRSEDGTLSELKKGAFHLAEMAGVPIVPIGIRGTRTGLPRGAWLIRRAKVHIAIGAPLVPDGKKAPAARDRLRASVAAALLELASPPPDQGGLAPTALDPAAFGLKSNG
jgi:1-acyl-sn-glycerol-3-phosphate acyltransferase